MPKPKPKTKRPVSTRVEAHIVEERINRYLGILEDALESYEKEHPQWRTDAILSLIQVGLQNLRHYIESKNDTEVGWDQTFATFHYPVEWNWAAWAKRDKFGAGVMYGTLTKANTATRKEARKALAKIMVAHVILQTLQEFTNFVAFMKRGTRYTPIVSMEVGHLLRRIRGRNAKRKALESLFRPFSMGAASVDFDESEFTDAGRVPSKIAAELKEASAEIDHPGLEMNVFVNDHALKLLLVFQIHPLIVDVKARSAHFPITTGFLLLPEVSTEGEDIRSLMDQPWANPKNWKATDRRKFWKLLHEQLDLLRKDRTPAVASGNAHSILTVNAKLRIPASGSGLLPNEAMAKMLEGFQFTGELIELDYAIAEGTASVSADTRIRLGELLRNVDGAITADQKGHALEDLIEALFATVPGFELKQRVRTETEEIDLTVLNGSGDTRWKTDEPLILVECKNWSSNCGKNEIVQFKEKLSNRRGRSTLGFFISWNGFADTVTKELLRGSRERLLIVPLDGEQIRQAVREGAFLKTLQKAWEQAVML